MSPAIARTFFGLALVCSAGCTLEAEQQPVDAGECASEQEPYHWDAKVPNHPMERDSGRPVDAGHDASPMTQTGCDSDEFFEPLERDLYQQLSPLPEVPPDPTNAYADNPAAAELGRKLFFETAYAGPLAVASDLGQPGETGKISCYSCHSGEYLDDQRSVPNNVSLGANFHTRNSPTTINSAFYRWTNWGGRFSAQWELPLPVAESPVIMNSTRLRVVHVIFDKYRDEYNAIFEPDLEPAIGSDLARFPATGKPKPAATPANPNPPDGAWELMAAEDRAIVNRVFVHFGKAIAAYMRLLVSRNAPFDRFVAGNSGAIPHRASKRGLKLFVGKARCVTCHTGSHFSDDAFHNLGVPQIGAHVPAKDEGRFKDIPPLLASPFSSATSASDAPDAGLLLGLTSPPPAETLGRFRTPDLRGVALTAPYMHSGQFQTLEQVIAFYSVGGSPPAEGMGELDPLMVPLHLSGQEQSDIVAFLRTLTGEPVDTALSHPPLAGGGGGGHTYP